MLLEISNIGETKIKNNEYHFVLTEYPDILSWEWNGITAFIAYEKSLGVSLEYACENKDILQLVTKTADKMNGTEYIPPIEDAIEEFVYHATNVDAAMKILSSGELLSASKVYSKTGMELSAERSVAGWGDPPDFYEYIMFGWGTHLVGDYVVLSESFPNQDDFINGRFNAGVRFYIRYNDIIKHTGHTFDGYHPIKVKDRLNLSDYLYACIVPEQYKAQFENCVADNLKDKVHYLPQRGLTLETWNENVIEYLNNLFS